MVDTTVVQLRPTKIANEALCSSFALISSQNSLSPYKNMLVLSGSSCSRAMIGTLFARLRVATLPIQEELRPGTESTANWLKISIA